MRPRGVAFGMDVKAEVIIFGQQGYRRGTQDKIDCIVNAQFSKGL